MNTATQHHSPAETRRRRKQMAYQRRQRLLLVIGGAAATLLVLVLVFSTRTGGAGQPDFTASTLTGETVRLSDYRGQVVMLNFWATWCPPCRAEMPTIKAAYESYHDQGFTVLAINNAESAAQIQPFAQTLALQFPIVLDTRGQLQNVFGISAYPTSLFISPDGEIYARHSGMLDPQRLYDYIATGMAQRDPNAEA